MFFIATGLASSYWSNYIVRKLIDEHNNMLWRIPLIIQVIPATFLFFGMLFLYETPRWLCAHNKTDQAYLVLSKIRGISDVKEEMDQIQDSLNLELKTTSTWHQVFSIENRKRLFLGCALQTLQQLTGTNVINYFSPIVFRSIGLSSSEAELFATGVYGILKMIVVLVGFSSLIDRFGRRPLLIGGGVAMGCCMYAVSICVSKAVKPPTPLLQQEEGGGGLTLSAGLVSFFLCILQ
jgi:SP family sugar:H+ symporter-like MFS transporter